MEVGGNETTEAMLKCDVVPSFEIRAGTSDGGWSSAGVGVRAGVLVNHNRQISVRNTFSAKVDRSGTACWYP
jgi:hypothetical protein